MPKHESKKEKKEKKRKERKTDSTCIFSNDILKHFSLYIYNNYVFKIASKTKYKIFHI